MGEGELNNDHIYRVSDLVFVLIVGHHNYHHQFPMDYRNAYRWYQYDPTKWFIASCKFLGLASHLKIFPSNEVEKGALTMKLKELKEVQDSLKWPVPSEELPILSWESCECC
jgi:stearoyl-CoA desaturase (Delta-9 desaturase)